MFTSHTRVLSHQPAGCHIANIARLNCNNQEMYQHGLEQYPWLLGIEPFDPNDYHPEDLAMIPEVALNDGDDEEDNNEDWEDCDDFNSDDQPQNKERQMTLTLTNVTDKTNICYVTVFDVDLCGGDGLLLRSGLNSITMKSTAKPSTPADATSSDNTTTTTQKCTTFIVLCPSQTLVHLCALAPNEEITSWLQVDIESDVQPWSCHKIVDDEHPCLLRFPFSGAGYNGVDCDQLNSAKAASYQCTQSENGQLTHFFHGNHHAIDFSCPIGTPLYVPVDGIVTEVNDTPQHAGEDKGTLEVSGIAARNMFHWNSIMIRADDGNEEDTSQSTPNPLYVEYVHIQSNSCVVRVGDRVHKGQLICKSGSVGFSPEPHLHLAAYRRNDNNAATVRVQFEQLGVDGSKKGSFLPRAGGWYNKSGLDNSRC